MSMTTVRDYTITTSNVETEEGPRAVAVLAVLWSTLPLSVQGQNWEQGELDFTNQGMVFRLENDAFLIPLLAPEHAMAPKQGQLLDDGAPVDEAHTYSRADVLETLSRTRGIWVCACDDEGLIVRQQGFAWDGEEYLFSPETPEPVI